ncbi:hypothetical protein D3C86_2060040 [compost metagenome]
MATIEKYESDETLFASFFLLFHGRADDYAGSGRIWRENFAFGHLKADHGNSDYSVGGHFRSDLDV